MTMSTIFSLNLNKVIVDSNMLNGHVFLSLISQHLIFKVCREFNPFHNNLIQHQKITEFSMRIFDILYKKKLD